MKTHIYTLFIITSFIGCKQESSNVPIEETSSQSLAEVVFLEQFVDKGKVKKGVDIEHEFKFVNTGTDTLKLDYLNADCKCSEAYFSDSTILPNDTAYVFIKIDTHDKAGLTKLGATLSTNTRDKLYRVTIQADIID